MSNSFPEDCFSIDDLVGYFSGGLPEDETDEIEFHLLGCPFCSALADRAADFTQAVLTADIKSPYGIASDAEIYREVESVLQAEAGGSALETLLEKFRAAAEIGVCAVRQAGRSWLSQAPEMLFRNQSVQTEWASSSMGRGDGNNSESGARGTAAHFASGSLSDWFAAIPDSDIGDRPESQMNAATTTLPNGATVSFTGNDGLRVNVDEWRTEGEIPVVVVVPIEGGEPKIIEMETNGTDFWKRIEIPEGRSLVLVTSAPKKIAEVGSEPMSHEGSRLGGLLQSFLDAKSLAAALSKLTRDMLSRQVAAGAMLLFGERGEFELTGIENLLHFVSPATPGAVRGGTTSGSIQTTELVSSDSEVKVSFDPNEFTICVRLGREAARDGRSAVIVVDETGQEIIITSGELDAANACYVYETAPCSANGKYLILVA